MEYCFVEYWQPGYTFPKGAQAVALTPQAVYHLEKDNIPYILFEEFYNSGDVRGDVEAHVREQNVWFDEFDRYIQELYPRAKVLDVRVATMLYMRIKYQVDDVILSVKMLRQFLAQANPSKVWFVYCSTGPRHVACNFYVTEQSLFSRLIGILCAEQGVACEHLDYFAGQSDEQLESQQSFKSLLADPGQLKKTLISKIPKPLLKRLLTVKNQRHWKRTQQQLPQYKLNKGKILILRKGGLVFEFCKDLKENGFDVYIKDGETIRRYGDIEFRAKDKLDALKADRKIDFDVIDNSAFDEFCNSRIVQWVIEKCDGLDITPLVRQNFEIVLKDFAPTIIKQVEQYVELLNHYEFDYVATHLYTMASELGTLTNDFSFDVKAAIAAAPSSYKTKTIGLSHGFDVFEAKSRFYYLTNYYDFYLFATQDEADHEDSMKALFGSKNPLAYSMDYIEKHCVAFKNKYQPATFEKEKYFKTDKPLVVFVPIMVATWPNRPVEKGQSFPMEYVEWHKALFNLMLKRKDYCFVWKGIYGRGQKFELMNHIISDSECMHVKYISNSLLNWLCEADRVICDVPSTAFYEAMSLDKPLVSLYRPREQNLRANVEQQLGNSLQPHSSITEGLNIINKFLDGNPGDYVVSQKNINPFPISELLKYCGPNANFPFRTENKYGVTNPIAAVK